MQIEGKPKFFRHHERDVRGIAFSPKDRYLFTSGGADGKINIYNAHNASINSLLVSFKLTQQTSGRGITAIKFTPDGTKILATSTAKRLAVLDVERGNQIQCYDNCAFFSKDRIALSTDPNNPNVAVCNCSDGKSLTLLDIRMPMPREFLFNLHASRIQDIAFVNSTWPFVKSHGSGLISVSVDGVCKVTTLDGKVLHTFSVGHRTNTVVPTPEDYASMTSNGFESHIVVGGDNISCYTPENEKHNEIIFPPATVCRLKYTASGGFLYAACEGGKVKRFRRYPNDHKYIGDVITHKMDVYDLDISPYDEFLVTASKDRTVGVLNLGAPNRGWSSYYELT